MAILLADDSRVTDSEFDPLYVPYRSVGGAIAAWRGDFSVDLTGHGHTLTKIGNPNQAKSSVICNKDNGYRTDVPDGINRTLIVIHRASAIPPGSGQVYSYPFGNLSQLSTATGVGIGILSAVAGSANLFQMSGRVGADKKDTTLFSSAMAPGLPANDSLGWIWSSFGVDGDNNLCRIFTSKMTAPVVGQNNGGVQLKNRWLTNQDGSPAPYLIGAWRDPTTPAAASTTVEVASVAVFDRALLESDLRQQKEYDTFWAAQWGKVIQSV